jgi:hypothetical protein
MSEPPPPPRRKYAVIDCEDSPNWATAFSELLAPSFASPDEQWDLFSLAAKQELPTLADGYAGIVLTGSHYNVREDAPFQAPLVAFLRECLVPSDASDDPSKPRVVGICYGHQVYHRWGRGELPTRVPFVGARATPRALPCGPRRCPSSPGHRTRVRRHRGPERGRVRAQGGGGTPHARPRPAALRPWPRRSRCARRRQRRECSERVCRGRRERAGHSGRVCCCEGRAGRLRRGCSTGWAGC